jgi:hypothetical protein
MDTEEPTAMCEYVSICQLTMDDPHPESNMEEGDIILQAGNRNEHGNAYSVHHDGEFVDITCDVLAILRPATEMAEDDIVDWAARRAKRTNLMDRLANYDNE